MRRRRSRASSRRTRSSIRRSCAAQVVFVDADDRRQVDTDYNNVSPRLGLAWNLAEKTVIRSG